MLDSLFSLRALLLFIGIAIVIGVYLYGTRHSKRNTRIKHTRRRRFSPRKSHSAYDEAVAATPNVDDSEFDDPLGEIVGPARVVSRTENELDLPEITREGAAGPPPTSPPAPASKRERSQLELSFDSETAETRGKEEVASTLISLYVRAPNGREFAGPAILGGANSVGLRFGEMQIFHHFGAGELRCEEPLFSLANMVEPGHFDLTKMDRFSTPGLAMFLPLPASLDGAVAFELFLNTAQRLAEALSGDLYSAPDTLLDGVAIEKMRSTAVAY